MKKKDPDFRLNKVHSLLTRFESQTMAKIIPNFSTFFPLAFLQMKARSSSPRPGQGEIRRRALPFLNCIEKQLTLRQPLSTKNTSEELGL